MNTLFLLADTIWWENEKEQAISPKMTEVKFELKLIAGFNGFVSGPSVVEWMENAELVCKMCQMKYPEHSLLKANGWCFCYGQVPNL